MSHDTTKSNKDFISYDLANWAANLTYEKLSPEAIHSAKLFLYDSLGCALGGSKQHDVEITLDHFKDMGGTGTCTVFGSGFKTDPVTAAFLNALCIRAMDYNDIYWKADPSHPSDIIPAPLSICEMNGLTGKDLILGDLLELRMWSNATLIGNSYFYATAWNPSGKVG
ncbi:MAG: hypothetical protein HOC27_07115, partial [Phycisphaerae bacterium]|nr:hypothetical protein [Phycisphaerae bacterium]